jgi:hypothetical protein
MPVVLVQISMLVVKALIGMATALLSDVFIRGMIIEALQALADKTESDWDNKLLERAREVWEK